MTRFLFIGRFQPFHNGHAQVINRLQEEGAVVVGIGSQHKHRTWENPLTFQERVACVKQCFPHAPVFGVPDVHDDGEWVELVEQHADFDTVISGNEWTQQCFAGTDYAVREPGFVERDRYQGTVIRNRARHGKRWKHLVPAPVLAILEQLHFAKLVRDLTTPREK